MKTAIEQLIEELIECKKLESNPFIVSTISLITNMAEDKLETEKRQIIEAYEMSAVTTGKNGELLSIPGEQYYNETFTGNK